jgi:hypothetical protein
MKTPKKPFKEPSLPTQDEYRRYNVLLEQMNSKFDAFGEGQSLMRECLDRIEPKLDHLSGRVDVLESAVRYHSTVINSNTEAIRGVQADLKNINHRLNVVETKGAS